MDREVWCAAVHGFIKSQTRLGNWTELNWVKVKSLSHVRLFATPWTVAYQAPPSVGFSRQEYWSGWPFPSPGDLPNPGIEPGSPTLQADTLPSEPPGKLWRPAQRICACYSLLILGRAWLFQFLFRSTGYMITLGSSSGFQVLRRWFG